MCTCTPEGRRTVSTGRTRNEPGVPRTYRGYSGEERVEPTLAQHPVGVRRCEAGSGRVFPGTLSVEAEQFRGTARLARWFDPG
jgi:hypothetical protein